MVVRCNNFKSSEKLKDKLRQSLQDKQIEASNYLLQFQIHLNATTWLHHQVLRPLSGSLNFFGSCQKEIKFSMLRALKNSPITAKGKKEKTFFAADETILRVFSFFSIMARKIFPIYDMGYVLKSHCLRYFYQTWSLSVFCYSL